MAVVLQELKNLNTFVDSIHQILSEVRILCEGLVILPLEVVNVTQPRPHQQTYQALLSQVVPR